MSHSTSIDTTDTHSGRYYELITERLRDKATTRRFKRDAVVVTIGDQSDTVYFVVSGELKVCITGEDGKEVILNIIGPGESFGELAVFTGRPRSADVVVRSDCELLIVARHDYLQALSNDAKLTMAALEHHANMVYCLTDQISSLALVDVYGRVAHHLLTHATEINSTQVVAGMTHQDIAAAIGASREMVSKILSDLKKGGYIDTQRRKITLLKPLPKGW